MNDTDFSDTSAEKPLIPLLMISAVSVTINILSIVTLSQCVRIDKRIKLMIRNIAVADVCLGFNPTLIVISDYFGFSDTIVGCHIHLILNRVLSFTKLFAVSILAVDRFVCLYLSNWYLKYVSERLIFAVALAMWVTSCGITVGSYASGITFIVDCFNENLANGVHVVLSINVACGLIIIGAYTGVLLNVLKHARNMKTLNLSNSSSPTGLFRSTMILCLLMLVFVLCYTPAGVYRTMVYLNPDWKIETGIIRNVTDIICMTSTIINPVLYVWRFKECRIRMSKMLCRCRKQYLEKLDRRQKFMCASFLTEMSNVSPPCEDTGFLVIEIGESHI